MLDLRPPQAGSLAPARFAPPPKRHTVPKKGGAVEEFRRLRAPHPGQAGPTAPVVTSREPSDQEKVAKGCLCAEKGRITVRKLILATGLSSQRVYAAVIALRQRNALPLRAGGGKSATSGLPGQQAREARDGARSTLLSGWRNPRPTTKRDDHPPIEDLADVDPVDGRTGASISDQPSVTRS
ncbi:MAG: hypothetical protein U0790_25105 [Isosphaeraceae bacterium]